MRIARVQQPAKLGVRTVLDHLANELLADALTAVFRHDGDIRQIGQGLAVRERAGETDLAPVCIGADDTFGFGDEPGNHLARPPLSPVRVVREEGVDGVDVDSARVVVQLDAGVELALHGSCSLSHSSSARSSEANMAPSTSASRLRACSVSPFPKATAASLTAASAWPYASSGAGSSAK